jgi:hypothetical protein
MDFSIDIQHMTQETIPDAFFLGGVPISPDRMKMAFLTLNGPLMIVDSLGRPLLSIPNPDESLNPGTWLTDSLFWYSIRTANLGGPFDLEGRVILHPIRVLDIESGMESGFDPSFPEMDRNFYSWTGTPLDPSRFTPSPSLSHIIYVAETRFQELGGLSSPSLAIWDIAAKRRVRTIVQFSGDAGIMGGYPAWFPDGSSFLTSAPIRFNLTTDQGMVAAPATEDAAHVNVDDDLPYVGGFDLIEVGLDGETSRLTYLSSRFSAVQTAWKLSPDGTHVAFWLSGQGSPWPGTLSVADITTGEVTDYCIPTNYGGRLIWAPEGRFLAFNSKYSDDVYPDIFLIDTVTGSTGVTPLWWTVDSYLFTRRGHAPFHI